MTMPRRPPNSKNCHPLGILESSAQAPGSQHFLRSAQRRGYAPTHRMLHIVNMFAHRLRSRSSRSAKLADHPQAFADIVCVARITRAVHQSCDCRVHVEAGAEKGPEMLSQLDRAIHQSVQLKIDHALNDLVHRRFGHRAWHFGKMRWCDLFRNEITAEQRIDGSRCSHTQLRNIVHRVRSGPGMPGLGGDVTGPGRTHESEVEYPESVGSKNVADRHEMRSGVWLRNGESRLDNDAHHVRLRQIPLCPTDDLWIVPVTIDLDVVGRRDHAL